VRRSDRSPQQAVEEIIRLRPRVERRHIFIGRFEPGQGLPDELLELGEAQRDEALMNAVRGAFGEAPEAAHLTRSGFVITADEELAAQLHEAENLEDMVFRALQGSAPGDS
jgi:hypothetical protein